MSGKGQELSLMVN